MAGSEESYRFISTLLCVVLRISAISGQQPTVDLSVGTLVGVTEIFSTGTTDYPVNTFLGVPYAKPPVGDLRFRKPEELEVLDTNPYDATSYRSFCVQPPTVIVDDGEDEDCLYLNVFVPTQSSEEAKGHAVMVWIYGGSFTSGASNIYHASGLAALGNVIVVTVNYRLGIFGFLSTGDAASPGNYGMFDQVMAFEWVQNNIAAFGGDRTRVTIFGESAGAMSVSMHGLYPKNRGLFQRVIAQSGAATASFLSLGRDVGPSIEAVAKEFECSLESTYSVVECLRNYTWRDIKSKVANLDDPMMLFFMPVLDDDFITTDYRHAFKKQSQLQDRLEFCRSLGYMNGINEYDGAEMLPYIIPPGTNVDDFQPTQEDMTFYVNILNYTGINKPFPQNVGRMVLHEYTNWTNPTSYKSVRLQIIKMMRDQDYLAAAEEINHLRLGDGFAEEQTYSYVFTPVTSSRQPWTPNWLPAADHGEEIRVVFGLYFEYLTDWEKELSVQIMTYWSNFAKSG